MCEIFKGAVVAPITEEVWIQGDVKIPSMRTMECHWAKKAISVLQGVVAVIPGCAILSDSELVGKAVSRSDGTLCDGIDAIVLERIEHAGAMPVDSSAIVLEIVLDSDLQPVTPAGFNPGARELAVEDFAAVWPCHAIGIYVLVRNIQGVLEDRRSAVSSFAHEVTNLSCDTLRCILIIIGENIVNPSRGIGIHDWFFDPSIPVGATCSVSPAAHAGVITGKARACVWRGKNWARRQSGLGVKPATAWELLCLHGGFTITSWSCIAAMVELGVSISAIG